MRRRSSSSRPRVAVALKAALFVSACVGSAFALANGQTGPVFVGSAACEPCHVDEYVSFMNHAKKGRSYQSIERLKKGLTKEEIKRCYACHTTGYGQPGGFVSPEETPHLKNAGCEVCHGPGSIHIASKDPREIKGHLVMEICEACHTSERVRAFRYTPLIHGGAH